MNNGVTTPSLEFFRQLRQTCEENDILLAYDEIQTAYGWLGEMSAAERVGVSPHMLAVSKGLTAGYGPLGATIGEARFSQERGTGESTNGSDLRSLVAVKACHERLQGIQKGKIPRSLPQNLQEELALGLLHTVEKKAGFIRNKIQDLVDKYPSFLGQLRGDNMIIGMPIKNPDSTPSPELAQQIYKDLLEAGVYVRPSKDALIVKPPLTITDEQVIFAIEQMEKVLRKYNLESRNPKVGKEFSAKTVVFQKIHAEIAERKEEGSSLIVGINGVDGAGKTQFTLELSAFLKSQGIDVQVIHLDDFHNPKKIRYEGENHAENYFYRSFNLNVLRTELLERIKRERSFQTTLTLLKLDTDSYDAEKNYTFSPDTIVLFEGVFLFRDEFRTFLDYKIFMDVPFDEAERRYIDRDGITSDRFRGKYMAGQKIYLDRYSPHTIADIVIENSDWERPKIVEY